MNDNEKSFLDGNTVMAIVLSIVFFIGWQFYMQKMYPNAGKGKQEQVASSIDASSASGSETIPSNSNENSAVVTKPGDEKPIANISVKETLQNFSAGTLNLVLSSNGMGFKDITLSDFTDREDKAIGFAKKANIETLAEGEDPKAAKYADIQLGNFATLYDGKPIPFTIKKISENEYLGKGVFSQGTVEKSVVFDPTKYLARVNIKVNWTGDTSKPVETYIVDRVMQAEESSLFVPSYEGSRVFALTAEGEEREMLDPTKAADYNYKQVSLVAVDSQYFSISMLDQSGIVPDTKISYDPTKAITQAKIAYMAANAGAPMEINFVAFMGPKKLDILKSIDEKMTGLIDYGFFSILSRPILSLLKGIYGLIHNWGIAIILLTIFIRLLLLPINISSYRSMAKMQKIQPLLKAVKEKYKDDPQKVNQETMLIMKREKANPIGGCLPMLMQIPVFFALFTVLGQSIELYKSPFAFWIQDLSYKDPFFVMPVVVGGLYFLQMQLTPNTSMDPTQAKIMKIIPLVFVFFMFSMPSGLTLYFAVNTIFGIGQQYVLQKEKRKAVAA